MESSTRPVCCKYVYRVRFLKRCIAKARLAAVLPRLLALDSLPSTELPNEQLACGRRLQPFHRFETASASIGLPGYIKSPEDQRVTQNTGKQKHGVRLNATASAIRSTSQHAWLQQQDPRWDLVVVPRPRALEAFLKQSS